MQISIVPKARRQNLPSGSIKKRKKKKKKERRRRKRVGSLSNYSWRVCTMLICGSRSDGELGRNVLMMCARRREMRPPCALRSLVLEFKYAAGTTCFPSQAKEPTSPFSRFYLIALCFFFFFLFYFFISHL